MIVIFAVLAGAILGALTAKKRNGKPADIAQYAAVYAIAFGIVGMLATIMIHRAAV
ncbi:apolipoprotein acyltransferase [Falsiphaeobacter marinintestinus]|uniref:apolipoprotein acyltransferase n=1 Tax=Falsiphaeobacter marinintestinus TaxID=1492905 RepID=UPI0011B65181|nr:apolipoprotein acyltransferase [Phaeobacter marinintestinus]